MQLLLAARGVPMDAGASSVVFGDEGRWYVQQWTVVIAGGGVVMGVVLPWWLPAMVASLSVVIVLDFF